MSYKIFVAVRYLLFLRFVLMKNIMIGCYEVMGLSRHRNDVLLCAFCILRSVLVMEIFTGIILTVSCSQFDQCIDSSTLFSQHLFDCWCYVLFMRPGNNIC